jgi:hypothetical protein
MDTITRNQREVLLDPLGNQVVSTRALDLPIRVQLLTHKLKWSGRKIQSLNTTAVTWAMAKYVYGFKDGGYGM